MLVHKGIVYNEGIVTKVEWEGNKKVMVICSTGVVTNSTETSLGIMFRSEYWDRPIEVPPKGEVSYATRTHWRCKDATEV